MGSRDFWGAAAQAKQIACTFLKRLIVDSLCALIVSLAVL
jgi:hypothetical protein